MPPSLESADESWIAVIFLRTNSIMLFWCEGNTLALRLILDPSSSLKSSKWEELFQSASGSSEARGPSAPWVVCGWGLKGCVSHPKLPVHWAPRKLANWNLGGGEHRFSRYAAAAQCRDARYYVCVYTSECCSTCANSEYIPFPNKNCYLRYKCIWSNTLQIDITELQVYAFYNL